MKICFIGDIVGSPGRDFLKESLAQFKEENKWDFVIANGENSAGGNGITGKIAHELNSCSVDAITLGDHTWDQKTFVQEIDSIDFLCRPANLPQNAPGRHYVIKECGNKKIGIFTVLGTTFMKVRAECPFKTADRVINEIKDQVDIIIVEVHAEATSEKIALGWYLDGRVNLVVGTHTHIPTADARVLPQGTAYITDVGMTGPYKSVLGREVEPILSFLLNGIPRRFKVAEDDVRLCGCVIEVDANTCKTRHIERIEFKPSRTIKSEIDMIS